MMKLLTLGTLFLWIRHSGDRGVGQNRAFASTCERPRPFGSPNQPSAYPHDTLGTFP